MKKIFISCFLFLGLSALHAQEVMDLYRFSQTDLTGTARSVSMGGAIGAIGNDVSAIAVNPAGIGTYRGVNEILGTLNLQSQNLETELSGNKMKTDKTYFRVNNLAYVGSFFLGDDAVPFINVGFSYNRKTNFGNVYNMGGLDNGLSISNIMADQAFDIPSNSLSLETNPMDKWASSPWLAIMGYNSHLINPSTNGNYKPNYTNTTIKELYNRQKGSINSYDINIGTEIDRVLSIGMSVSITDLSYSLYSNYYEALGYDKDFLGLRNYEKTDGTGYQISAGVLFKPVDNFTIGVAYHSPTWYDMRRYVASDLSFINTVGLNIYEGTVSGFEGKNDLVVDYNMRTPDRWSFSLATVIKGAGRNIATIAADYELTNYKNMRFTSDKAYYEPQNQDLKNYFRMASTLRVGAEVAITPNFLARVGYSWQQAAAKDDVVNGNLPIYTSESITQYVFPGDVNNITWGLGYRFQNGFFVDLAFLYQNQTNKLYSSPVANSINLKNNSYQGLLTLGYRFSTM